MPRSHSPAGRLGHAEGQSANLPNLIQFMSLLSVALTLIVVGVLLWLVNNYIPMDGKIKKILNVVVVVCVIVWLLYAFGIVNRAGDIRLPRV